jgi:hypothetical protein
VRLAAGEARVRTTDRGLRDRHGRRRRDRAPRRPPRHRGRPHRRSRRRAGARGRRPPHRRARLPGHAGPRQLPPPPLPVGHARPRAAGDALRVARRALSGVGARRRRGRVGGRPRPGWPRSRGRAARPRPTTTTSSRPAPVTCSRSRSRRPPGLGVRFHPCRGSMDLGQSVGRPAARRGRRGP